jgi:hypothetical protein
VKRARMLHHLGSSSGFPTKEGAPAPTIHHRAHLATVLGPASRKGGGPPTRSSCPRIPYRVVFEKLVQVLVFGCAYWRIADGSCSATTLLRRRRDEWIEEGVMDELDGV